MRKTPIVFLPLMALAAVLLLGLPAQAEDEAAEAPSLAERVERLETENADLRARLEKLEKHLAERPAVHPPRPPRPRRAPEARDRRGPRGPEAHGRRGPRGNRAGERGPRARGRPEGARGPHAELEARLGRIEHMLHRLLGDHDGEAAPEGMPPRPPLPPQPRDEDADK